MIIFGLSLGGFGALLTKPSVELPPLTERLARGMIEESIDVKNLFNGEESRPRLDVERLVEVLIRVSYLIADFPEIESLDINPVLLSNFILFVICSYIIICLFIIFFIYK